MMEYDTSSINSFVSSYHKLTKTSKHSLKDKLELPPFHGHLFVKGNLNTAPLKAYLLEQDHKL
jgi:hypothetical protein